MTRSRVLTLTSVVLAAAATRVLPHPPNLTSIAAVAMFAGAHFDDRRLAFAIPICAMLVSDVILGFHSGVPAVYVSICVIVGLGLLLRSRRQPALIAATAVAGALLFFAITNFSVWALGGLYPRTTAGLAACYIAALPFLRNTLIGDLAYSLLLFGGFVLLERRFQALRPSWSPRTCPA